MATKTNIIDRTEFAAAVDKEKIVALVEDFADACAPLECDRLLLLQDKRTGAAYIECHVAASKLMHLATIDVPIDPDDQADYRANRDIVEDHIAFEQMKQDAIAQRTFSNIVSEFSRAFDPEHPIKIIGGQHRYSAIKEAFDRGVDEYHGLKIYFGLDNDQRIDVQLISNTNIAVSTDLFDRMQETLAGPALRDWCQAVGLLAPKQDFADKRLRSNPITVRSARTFIVNYFRGAAIPDKAFDSTETTPMITRSGANDPDWDELKKAKPALWSDKGLLDAGKAFAALIEAQRKAFTPTNANKKAKAGQTDFAEKALNFAVLSAWAFIAGVLSNNQVRLARHYALADQTGRDPLNAASLAKGRHKTDAENYRGLGYRTDAKERGRLAELFFLQAEDASGITAAKIDLAIKKYHAKEALLEVKRAESKVEA
ncbi:hypothetical protein [Rhodoferax sediminis]|uniref:Uncharacterized protein n=1 Tax=Rhodoferax sediminis TaxID=2509614 RepID=A0A515DBD4_9BURK|nr:hypothetical protein [Rhodoferax sediminis]QDL37700.1 hypothetical protein EUB48_10775 [Rhodoferax sediminis]